MVAPKVGIIIQARLNSARLPGKILLPLPQRSGLTILDHIIRRSQAVKPLPEIILATSTHPENDVLKQEALKNRVLFFRGEENDVLSRFYFAAREFHLDVIIRLTADNPFIDPEVLSETLQDHLDGKADYTYTTGLPLGTNLEIFQFQALEQAFRQTTQPEHREHVTPFLRQNPHLFSIREQAINWGKDLSGWRLTIDNESDYALAVAILLGMPSSGELISLQEIVRFLNQNPVLLSINQHNYQKKVFETPAAEMQEAIRLLQANDLSRAAGLIANNFSFE